MTTRGFFIPFICTAMLLLLVAGAPGIQNSAWADGGGITVEGAWVRAIPPVVKNTAGYLTIINHGKHADKLMGASTKIAKVVEIHNVFRKDGMMEMRPVKTVPIPAGRRTALKSGGYHLMIIGLKRVPKAGERVELTLKFRHAGEVKVMAEVRQGEPMKHGHGMKPMKGAMPMQGMKKKQ